MAYYIEKSGSAIMKRGINGLNRYSESVLLGEAFEQPELIKELHVDDSVPLGRQVARPDNFWGWNPVFTVSISSAIPDWGLALIMDGFAEVQKYATFKVERLSNDNHSAMIRIANVGEGSWSYVGTGNLHVNKSKQTMNLGAIKGPEPAIDTEDRRYAWYTVVHEICHMLGMRHGQDNPDRPFDIDVGFIMKESGMSESGVRSVYDSVSPDDSIVLSQFDPDSIMLYALPKGWIIPHEGHPDSYEMAYTLSNGDKSVLRALFPDITKEWPFLL